MDTDVLSYIFRWHTSAAHYVELLIQNEVLVSFVTPAEMRLGALKRDRKLPILECRLSIESSLIVFPGPAKSHLKRRW